MLPDVGIWCNRALCVETTHSTYFTATSPLVSVLFVPSLHSYYFSRKCLFFSSIYIWSAITVGPHYLCVMLCNAVTSITAMCVCLSLPCSHLFIPIESSMELYTHNTPVCLSCIHMTHLYFLVKALVVDFFGFG